MNLVQTLILIVIAIAVLILLVWLFGGFKGKLDDSFKPEKEDLEVQKEFKVFNVPQSIPDGKSGNKITTYKVLDKYYKNKSGDYYQVIESSNGRRFYLNTLGNRVYIPVDEQLTDMKFLQ